MVKTLKFSVIPVALFLALMANSSLHAQTPPSASVYKAKVVRTSYGIPHITAEDYGSLGYGEGYAAAEDHVCNIADAIITARGEQAMYFGPGENNKHVMADIVIHALDIPNRAHELLLEVPPRTLELLIGYAAGYNAYLRESEVTSWCKGDDFVREITVEDLLRRRSALVQTVPRMAAMIVGAQPPAGNDANSAAHEIARELYALAAEGVRLNGMGSNGWAIGKDRTENGHGMLLGNPHYPWNGINRFWEKHLIIPGTLNVYGAGIIAGPGVAIGFNENVGWTHTVSNSQRLVLYKLDLVPGDPTSYLYDGQPRKMTARTVSVRIKTGDGKFKTKEHTVWFSHYGPMLVMPGLEWTETTAFSVRDANAENHYAYSQWLDMAAATDMDAFKEAHRKWNAMPWVNTIATSRDGRAVYLDNSNVGHLSEEAIALWRERVKTDPLTKSVFEKSRMTLLDGSDSRFEWQVDPDTLIEGVVPYDEKPLVDRSDFVFNSNDSYWLTNPSAPLTGYSPLYGPVETPRSLRTRMNAIMLSDLSSSGPSGSDGRFSLAEMQQAIFSNRSLIAELLRDELVAACANIDFVEIDSEMVDLKEARRVIAAYNGRLDLDSEGAVLFREWITAYKYAETFTKSNLFAVPFDANDPLNTPRGLADTAVALQKLGHAVQVLNRAGLDLDCTLADTQFAYRSGTRIAVHGGNRYEGIANLIIAGSGDWRGYKVGATKIDGSRFLTDKGYPVIHGSSFVLCLNYTDDGPHAEALLTYSQSGDPTSKHYTDQTRLFAAKQWRPILFSQKAIDANTISVKVLTGPR